MRTILPALVLLVGCSGDKTTPSGGTGDTSMLTDTTTTDTQTHPGACGATTTWDVTIAGTVRDSAHQPAIGAAVALEERVYNTQPKTYGAATTDAYGHFELVATQVVSIEDCWGILLDYHLLGSLGAESADDNLNTPLYNAIVDTTLRADLAVPIDLAP